MNFDESFTRLLGHEGKYSNHPKDRGGPTCWGITERVARSHGYVGAMEDLPVDTAKQIYFSDYWSLVQFPTFPEEVRYPLFDAAVNSGVEHSVKWLQQAARVTADGVVGPITKAAVKALPGYVLMTRMLGYRLQYLSTLPDWPAFGRGWANRIAKIALEA